VDGRAHADAEDRLEGDRSLLSDKIFDGFNAYEPPPPSTRGTLRMRFDNGKVAALWEDTSAKHDRVRKDWLAGMITRAEARTRDRPRREHAGPRSTSSP
jgi:hypothetical protein